MIQELSIVLSQMTQVVGDLAANADAMRSVRARHRGADLILYPEFQLIGYPPEDLVLKPALAERAAKLLAELARSEEHTSELQSLMRISYAVFCLKNKTYKTNTNTSITY